MQSNKCKVKIDFRDAEVSLSLSLSLSLSDEAPFAWLCIWLLSCQPLLSVRNLDCVETVDSLKLARLLDKIAAARPSPLNIMIQVNTSGEQSKLLHTYLLTKLLPFFAFMKPACGEVLILFFNYWPGWACQWLQARVELPQMNA